VAQNFPPDLRAAAHRHMLAADTLQDGPRKDVAGYLYGLAAECGFKALMGTLGMKPLPKERRSMDPFYAHFTELKSMVRDSAEGRQHIDLRKFAEDQNFMAHWDISMRYSSGKTIKKSWVECWRRDATAVIAEL